MNKNTLILSAIACAFFVSGCSSAKDKLGLTKSAPDEFMVVKNAPLAMPPDYSLLPPRPGAPRPQEMATSQAAKATVFGMDSASAQPTSASSSEQLLLQQAGSTQANPNIRNIVDAESAKIEKKNQSVAEKLVGWGDSSPGASVVNATEEAQRLNRNAAEGKPVTAGETPTIED